MPCLLAFRPPARRKQQPAAVRKLLAERPQLRDDGAPPLEESFHVQAHRPGWPTVVLCGLLVGEVVRLSLRFSRPSMPVNAGSTTDEIIARLRSHGLKFDPVYCTDENRQVQADSVDLAFLDTDP